MAPFLVDKMSVFYKYRLPKPGTFEPYQTQLNQMNIVLKTVLLAALTTASLLLAQPNRAVAQTTNTADDETAIKAVIIGETDAYVRRDFDAWAAFYVDSPQTSYALTPNSGPGTVVHRAGFAEMKQNMKHWMAASPKSEMTSEGRDNWNIKIGGNMAWAQFVQHTTLVATKTKLDLIELKVLEKINGQWKISTSAAIADFKNATPPMRSTY
jgi:hypothetical protein